MPIAGSLKPKSSGQKKIIIDGGMDMKMANHDCCEKKHCKCRGFLKFVFGAGVLGLLAHMVYGYLEEDKPCPLKGWLAKHGNESTAEFENFDD
jgi:hypothetical protein